MRLVNCPLLIQGRRAGRKAGVGLGLAGVPVFFIFLTIFLYYAKDAVPIVAAERMRMTRSPISVDLFDPDSPLDSAFAKDLIHAIAETIWAPENETGEEPHPSLPGCLRTPPLVGTSCGPNGPCTVGRCRWWTSFQCRLTPAFEPSCEILNAVPPHPRRCAVWRRPFRALTQRAMHREGMPTVGDGCSGFPAVVLPLRGPLPRGDLFLGAGPVLWGRRGALRPRTSSRVHAT